MAPIFIRKGCTINEDDRLKLIYTAAKFAAEQEGLEMPELILQDHEGILTIYLAVDKVSQRIPKLLTLAWKSIAYEEGEGVQYFLIPKSLMEIFSEYAVPKSPGSPLKTKRKSYVPNHLVDDNPNFDDL